MKERNLVYCPIAKSGTSTWMTFLLEFSDKTKTERENLYKRHPHIGFELGHKVAPKMDRFQWKNWSKTKDSVTKVITVRHPFERLVSAFRQKIEAKSLIGKGSASNWIVNTFGKRILVYRKRYLEKFGDKSLSKENNYGAIGKLAIT